MPAGTISSSASSWGTLTLSLARGRRCLRIVMSCRGTFAARPAEDCDGSQLALLHSFGFLFANCRLQKEQAAMPDDRVALGRPWHPTTDLPDGTRAADPNAIGSVMFKSCWMDSHISAERWAPMSGKDKDGQPVWFHPAGARFFECDSRDPARSTATHTRR